jgi:hypothetical protein
MAVGVVEEDVRVFSCIYICNMFGLLAGFGPLGGFGTGVWWLSCWPVGPL